METSKKEDDKDLTVEDYNPNQEEVTEIPDNSPTTENGNENNQNSNHDNVEQKEDTEKPDDKEDSKEESNDNTETGYGKPVRL